MRRSIARGAALPVTFVVAAVSALLTLYADPASAAMCVDMSTQPARPIEGAAASVTAKELWAGVAGDTFHLVARRDGSADIPIALSRVAPGSLVWVGQVVFPEAGEWKLRVAIAAPENHYPCFEKPVFVVMTADERPAAGEHDPIALAGVVGLGATLLVAALVRGRSAHRKFVRRRGQHGDAV
jgi:hypothetical protein